MEETQLRIGVICPSRRKENDYDWYASGDTCKETYLKAKAEFKKKWIGNRGVRVRRIVDESLKQCKDELYETFGLEDPEEQKVTIKL